jgi:uncharacterized protein
MQTLALPLVPLAPGHQQQLTALRFGTPGRGPKAVIQAALHADEIPALLVAHKLRSLLAAEEAAGRVLGEVVLVPYANPLGLAQQLLGHHHGRFDLRDGLNFNRFVPDLTEAVHAAVAGRLGQDAAVNDTLVRRALADAAAALAPTESTAHLKARLLQLAADAHLVLDLHCDAEAVLHLYALTPQADVAAELGAELGAQAVLLATDSGDSPFDEACSRTWMQLQERLPGHPLPLGCFATTVELRGEADTDHALAEADAQALLRFLRRRGVLGGASAVLPAPRCEPTPLAGSEPITAPGAGVLVFHHAPGDRVEAGAVIADLVDVDSGSITPLRCRSAGLLYARTCTRWAHAGKRVAKVAGTALVRTGKLLSP